MKTVPLSNIQEELQKLVKRLQNQKKPEDYALTVRDGNAVFMSMGEYESCRETEEIKADPELMESIREGMEDIKAGRVYDWEDIKKELGWGKKLHVPNKIHQSRQARVKKH